MYDKCKYLSYIGGGYECRHPDKAHQWLYQRLLRKNYRGEPMSANDCPLAHLEQPDNGKQGVRTEHN